MRNNVPLKIILFVSAAALLSPFYAFAEEKAKVKEAEMQGSPKVESKALPDKTVTETAVPVDPNSPTSTIKKYEAEVKSTVTRYKGLSDDQNVKKKNDEILEKVRKFFDIPELARLSLGNHWDKIDKKQQDEYSDVFRQLIERSYISKSDKLIGDYEVKYLSEMINDKTAEVKSSVLKEDADVDILYKMHMKNDGWMIYNIIADNVDLVKNYNSQFNSLIGKEGFDGLMKKMKNKLTDSNGT